MYHSDKTRHYEIFKPILRRRDSGLYGEQPVRTAGYSIDHGTQTIDLSMDDPTLKNQFAQEMQDALDRVGGKINIYDTIDLYLAEK